MNATNLTSAKEYCVRNKQRLTQPRLEVLKIIFDSAKPLGAYEVLDQLANIIKDPKPPTAYRAIEFWQSHGFVHRIESLNAYVACKAGHQHKGSQFMICDECGSVTETHLCKLPIALQQSAETKGFISTKWNVELHGTCSNCHA